MTAPTTIDEYISARPAPVQRILLRIRSVLRRAVQDARELRAKQNRAKTSSPSSSGRKWRRRVAKS